MFERIKEFIADAQDDPVEAHAANPSVPTPAERMASLSVVAARA